MISVLGEITGLGTHHRGETLTKHSDECKTRMARSPSDAEEKLFASRISHHQKWVYANRTMMDTSWRGLLWLLCAFFLCHCALGLNSVQLPVLRVGEERKRESLAFFDGSSREYEVHGLQERKWYEIKISYPSCISASIDVRFLQYRPDYRRRAGRKLLNTEKTMFYVPEDFSQQAKTAGPWGRATVEVHPSGVISKHLSSDHPFIIYNILCEEVVFGVPKQALWVGFLAAFVICSAFYISARLPASFVPANSRVAKDLKEAE